MRYAPFSAKAALTVAAMMIGFGPVNAGLLDRPVGPQSAIQHITFETPTLPPMAYTMFCLRYEDECRAKPLFRAAAVRLTEERWADIKQVNQTVNRSIIPESQEPSLANEPNLANEPSLADEAWLINPDRGDCNDYAVTKRHELLNRGWPSGALLLSEVVTNWGKHHLVLVVRIRSGDLVLDNLTPQIMPWTQAPYRWVRIQMPNRPRLWTTIAGRGE